jgi:hypothetical protein
LWNWISRLRRWAAGSYVFCEAAAFRELGGFDQSLFASEEIEFSQRLKRLARARDRRMVILRRHLITSARKLKIYTRAELGRFILRATFRPFSTIKNREACSIWYDGRR